MKDATIVTYYIIVIFSLGTHRLRPYTIIDTYTGEGYMHKTLTKFTVFFTY